MRLYTTEQIYACAMSVFGERTYQKSIAKMRVTVFDLLPYEPEQLSLFDAVHGDKQALSRSLDTVNDRYGDMVVGSALLANMEGFILDRISFGGVRDMEELCEDSS